ncbi:MAG: hypothetical protein VKL41_15370 [Snowella sp.]|jgi:hypothetical protein|nr:hypothetical protein [Snowella sp.]
MIETVLLSGVSGMTTEILLSSLRKLGRKYSVDIKYVLSEKVEADFQKCLNIAIKAFLEFVSKNTNLNKAQQKMIVEYLKSSIVTEEIWHLLDPGSEIFDRGLLTQNARETLLEVFGKETETIIFDAWEEFLKAFSFASRSAPELREFLRASYEAGSFKALSNIEDVLEKMDNAVSNLKNEELIVSHAIKDYTEDLKAYRQWAVSFQAS